MRGGGGGWLQVESPLIVEVRFAIETAEAFMRGETAAAASQQTIHEQLVRSVPAHDPFWPRWIVRTEKDS